MIKKFLYWIIFVLQLIATFLYDKLLEHLCCDGGKYYYVIKLIMLIMCLILSFNLMYSFLNARYERK